MMEDLCPFIFEIMENRPKTISRSNILRWVAQYYNINYAMLSTYWARWKKNPEGICFLPPELVAYIKMRVRELRETRREVFVHNEKEWLEVGASHRYKSRLYSYN